MGMVAEAFGKKFQRLVREKKSVLFLGVDPDLSSTREDFPEGIAFPNELAEKLDKLGLSHYILEGAVEELTRFIEKHSPTAETELMRSFLRFCALAVLSAESEIIGVKFQSACFERIGVFGLYALSVLARLAESLGLITILDAKRGDIGVTLRRYLEAYLAEESTPLRASYDAITVNPLLGIDTWEELAGFLARGKQVFFVAYPSSPTGGDFAEAQVCGKPLYSFIAESAREFLLKHQLNRISPPPIGFVVGANKPESAVAIRQVIPDALFLVPGVGAQGARLADVANTFLGENKLSIFPIARAILYSYRNLGIKGADVDTRVTILIDSIKGSARKFNEELHRAVSFE